MMLDNIHSALSFLHFAPPSLPFIPTPVSPHLRIFHWEKLFSFFSRSVSNGKTQKKFLSIKISSFALFLETVGISRGTKKIKIKKKDKISRKSGCRLCFALKKRNQKPLITYAKIRDKRGERTEK